MSSKKIIKLIDEIRYNEFSNYIKEPGNLITRNAQIPIRKYLKLRIQNTELSP